jgi:hypothetical protein
MVDADAKEWLQYLIDYVSRRVEKAGFPDWVKKPHRIDDNLSRYILKACTKFENNHIRDPEIANFLDMESESMYTVILNLMMAVRMNPCRGSCVFLFVTIGLFSVNLMRDGNHYESYQIVCETADIFPVTIHRIFGGISDLPSTHEPQPTTVVDEAEGVPEVPLYVYAFYLSVAAIACWVLSF